MDKKIIQIKNKLSKWDGGKMEQTKTKSDNMGRRRNGNRPLLRKQILDKYNIWELRRIIYPLLMPN